MVTALPSLTLEAVTVRRQGREILSDISARFEPQGLTVLMGPNGSGKTTLLRAMHGLERIRSGTLTWRDGDAGAEPHKAFVFQLPALLRRSVTDNIAYPLQLAGMDRATARKNAKVWVERIGLSDQKKIDVQFLSGGEKQKLAIARALITRPQVLFLDEPTTNLDGRWVREIEELIITASREGTRVFMSTHDLGQARRLASQIVFLHQGQLCEHTSAQAFFEQPATRPARQYLAGEIVE